MGKPKNNYKTEAGKSNPRDRFQSPGYALNPLLPFLNKEWTVWESAAGEGLLADALEIHGFSVLRSELLQGQDYFAYEPGDYDIQITNPPFSRKYAWLKRACDLQKRFALLMPADVLFAGDKAVPLIERYGIEVVIPRQRIDFKTPDKGWAGSGAQFTSAWFCYGLNIGKQITYADLKKPRRNKRTPENLQNPKQALTAMPDPELTALF